MKGFENVNSYQMRISRMTVDKLGVRLYDRVSAVVAELIANAYDADAENVTVQVPLSSLLAKRNHTSNEVEEFEYLIEVKDDGHGMTPTDANENFLWVGKNRRDHSSQGSLSKYMKRRVMGRKGIGKLAPFGICKIIEVISAGGKRTDKGYIVSHFIMDYDKILEHTDQPVEIEKGEYDCTFRQQSGTIIRLKNFLPKRVPNQETFHRQLSVRFGLPQSEFRIHVIDTRNPTENPPFDVGRYDIPLMEGTRIDYTDCFIKLENGKNLPISGWMGLAKNAYKNEEMAGVRIYSRGKIVATTRDFEKPAGYTGEFTLRSYLVGEIHAEWIDADDGDDLITTDRQDILWESNYGRALREWGANQIKAIGAASRKPRRDLVEHLFLEVSALQSRAHDYFADNEVAEMAISLGKQIGRLASEDELKDQEYVNDLTNVILTVAPHMALMEAFQQFSKEALGYDRGIEGLIDLFSKTRIAEMASYAQIASERVAAIRRLEKVIGSDASESDLQAIIAGAPWLIESTWTPITMNQSLKLFVRRFEKYFLDQFNKEVILAIDNQGKRPDFTLTYLGQKLHIIEIKAVGHSFSDRDWNRLHNYLQAFEGFFQDNSDFREYFSESWCIHLICDSVKISDRDKLRSYRSWKSEGRIDRISWNDFLSRAIAANEEFLNAQDSVKREDLRLSGK